MELSLHIVKPHVLYYNFFNYKVVNKFINLKKINLIADNSILQDCGCNKNCFYCDSNAFSNICPKKFSLEIYIDQAFCTLDPQNLYGSSFFIRLMQTFDITRCNVYNSSKSASMIACKLFRYKPPNKNCLFYDNSFYVCPL